MVKSPKKQQKVHFWSVEMNCVNSAVRAGRKAVQCRRVLETCVVVQKNQGNDRTKMCSTGYNIHQRSVKAYKVKAYKARETGRSSGIGRVIVVRNQSGVAGVRSIVEMWRKYKKSIRKVA